MLSPIPIIFVVTALVGIIALVARRLPELKNEPALSEHPSWAEKATVRSVFSFLGEKLSLIFRKILRAFESAKSEFKGSKDLAKHISQSVKSRFERKRHVAVQAAESESEEQKNGEQTSAQLESAEHLLEDGEYVAAEEMAIEILKDDPANKDAYEFLGHVYLAKKSFLEAVEVYRYLVKLSPQSDTYWARLGDGLVGLEDFEEAVLAYKKSLEIYHQSDILVSLGLAYQAMGDYVSACRSFENALDVEPDNTQVLMLLAQNFLHRNDTAAAQEVLEHILELEPGNMVARERLMQLKV